MNIMIQYENLKSLQEAMSFSDVRFACKEVEILDEHFWKLMALSAAYDREEYVLIAKFDTLDECKIWCDLHGICLTDILSY